MQTPPPPPGCTPIGHHPWDSLRSDPCLDHPPALELLPPSHCQRCPRQSSSPQPPTWQGQTSELVLLLPSGDSWTHVRELRAAFAVAAHQRPQQAEPFFGDPRTDTPFTLCSKEAIPAVSLKKCYQAV